MDARPVIPVFINCASPPVPRLARAAALGRRVGEYLAGYPGRILYVGSGGLSHDLPGFRVTDDGWDPDEEQCQAWIAEVNQQARREGTLRALTDPRMGPRSTGRPDRSRHRVAGSGPA